MNIKKDIETGEFFLIDTVETVTKLNIEEIENSIKDMQVVIENLNSTIKTQTELIEKLKNM